MTTASDVITASLRMLMVIADGETPSDAEAQDGLTQLNDLMFAFPSMGIDYTHSSLALTDSVPLDDKHIRGLKAMLAKEIAPMYERTPAPTVLTTAEEGLRQMQADYEEVQPVQVDTGLLGGFQWFRITTG